MFNARWIAVGTLSSLLGCAASADPVSDSAELTAFAPTPDYLSEKAWAEAHGLPIPPRVVTVVGKRRGSDARSESYDDQLVVFEASGALARFAGTTRPAQAPSPTGSVPDVDGNGTRDLGVARPGIYHAVGDRNFGLPGFARPAFHVTDHGANGLPAWRDLDGDGVFSDHEKQLSQQRNYKITDILIHYGFEPSGTTLGGETNYGAWSVGCQNVPYLSLDAFVAAVGGHGASFTYAIIEDR